MGLLQLIRSALKRSKRSESLEALESENLQNLEQIAPQKSLEIDKDSLSLGVAAGYTGRALREIESSLIRIETQMVTKDWYLAQEAPKIELLKSMLTTLNSLQNNLNSIANQSLGLPLTIKSQINQQIEKIRSGINETSEKIIQILKESNEMSYTDLAAKAELTESGLRGILSILARRDKRVKRFKIRKHGWVKLVDSTTDSNEQSATNTPNQ